MHRLQRITRCQRVYRYQLHVPRYSHNAADSDKLYLEKKIEIPQLQDGSKKLTVSLATTNDDIDEWLDTNTVSSSKSTKKNNLNRLSIGLDIEWRPNYQAGSKPNKTALIQLSTSSSCLLIPTHYFKVANSNNEFKFSDKFKNFLANADVLKVGCGVRADVKKLEKDFGFEQSDNEGVMEVNEIVSSLIHGYNKHKIDTTLRKDGGLKYLASHFLNIDLLKSKRISCSNWEKETLSSQQLKYAAYDALISKLVFDKAVEASEQQSKQYKVRVKVKKVKEKEVIANNRVTESRTREDKAAQEDQVRKTSLHFWRPQLYQMTPLHTGTAASPMYQTIGAIRRLVSSLERFETALAVRDVNLLSEHLEGRFFELREDESFIKRISSPQDCMHLLYLLVAAAAMWTRTALRGFSSSRLMMTSSRWDTHSHTSMANRRPLHPFTLAQWQSPSPVSVIVTVEIQPDRINDFLKLIEIDARDSREKELGNCLRFDVLRDKSSSNKFIFYEVYKDDDAINKHKEYPHYKLWTDFKNSGGVISQSVVKADGIFFEK